MIMDYCHEELDNKKKNKFNKFSNNKLYNNIFNINIKIYNY